jgi:macrolide transport system ATP-binding/permease protein
MKSVLRRIRWWLQPSRKERELREELRFHIDAEASERIANGVPPDEARWAAARDLGNEARVREEVRAVWTWRPLEELTCDVRYALRTLLTHRAVTMFAVASLALGIGANTAIYSLMDALLLRSLAVPAPESLVVMHWRSRTFERGPSGERSFVMHSASGSTFRFSGGVESGIFPVAAFERLREASSSTLSSVFAHVPAGQLNVVAGAEAELIDGHYVTGNFFGGLGVKAAAGRLIGEEDDRPGAPIVVAISYGYAERRFGAAANAVGQALIINGRPFTIAGVTSPEFIGVDPANAPSVFLPLQTESLLEPEEKRKYADGNYYWLEMMGRLRPGVSLGQAQAALAAPFASWVITTAATDVERANLPQLHLVEGGGGLDTLRRRYSRPLYVLFAMVALILAIACANTANLLLARAATRRREIAVRLSIGAGRFRLIRQLLTESLVLAAISGVVGVLIAVACTRLLIALLANGDVAFALQAELNWRVLGVTAAFSLGCGVLFGLVPAVQSTRPALIPALKGAGYPPPQRRSWRLPLQESLVVGQIVLLMLLLVTGGLFVRTLSNLQSVYLGFRHDNLLLFDLNAPQAGRPAATVAAFYDDLQSRFSQMPGVRAVTLSHSSLIRAGRTHPVTVDGVLAQGTRFLQTGPNFFSTMEIPIQQGREIDARDRAGASSVAVVSEHFASTFLPGQNPLGRRISVGGAISPLTPSGRRPVEFEIVGVAANARYGNLKASLVPVVYGAYAQIPQSQVQQMTFALRTDGDPLRHAGGVRQIVHDADPRLPVTNIVTQSGEIDRTINQEIVLARLATAFALLALVIAVAGLYGTMAYAVARRTREIGIRMALGARRSTVIWMVLRNVGVMTLLGLLISIPVARGSSRFVETFLFDTKPDDPRAFAIALVTLVAAALIGGLGPARRASTIDPVTALRQE